MTNKNFSGPIFMFYFDRIFCERVKKRREVRYREAVQSTCDHRKIVCAKFSSYKC